MLTLLLIGYFGVNGAECLGSSEYGVNVHVFALPLFQKVLFVSFIFYFNRFRLYKSPCFKHWLSLFFKCLKH